MTLHLEDIQEVRESELSTRAVPHDELRGAIVGGRYQLLERVRRGTVGVLYRGAHVELGRGVTIEIFDVRAQSSERAASEAATAARLSHPHCGAVLDIGTHETHTFIVRETLTGSPLEDVLRNEETSLRRAVEIMRQVLAGVGHAHERQVVHGGLSATNIIIEQKTGLGDHVRVIGFGATHRADADAQHDLQACGRLLSAMITNDLAALPLGDVVRRAVTSSASDRFCSASDFMSALDAAERELGCRQAPSLPAPIPALAAFAVAEKPPQRRRRGMLVSGMLLMLVGVAALGLRAAATSELPGAPAAVAPRVDPVTAVTVAPAGADSVQIVLTRANQLTADGNRSGALDLLVASRVTYPKEARLPRLAGTLYFEMLWWADGIKQLRAAFDLDPALRKDPEIATTAVTGFITTPTYNQMLGRFVREELGAAAVPRLERVAREHRNPTVRARAQAELRRIAAN